jgi:hypothetical protein
MPPHEAPAVKRGAEEDRGQVLDFPYDLLTFVALTTLYGLALNI